MMTLKFRGARLGLRHDRRAVTAIEYALMAALVAVVIIGAVLTLGHSAAQTLNTVSNALAGTSAGSVASSGSATPGSGAAASTNTAPDYGHRDSGGKGGWQNWHKRWHDD